MENIDFNTIFNVNEAKEIPTELLEYLKPVGKVLIPYGYSKDSNQVLIGLKFIEGMNISKIEPYIKELTLHLKKIKISKKSKEFCVFPILDNETGFDGKHTLLITENNEALILKEYFEENQIIKKFKNIEKALEYIANKLYYFEATA